MKRRRGRGEGAIRQRADGRWEARCSFGYDHASRRIRKSVYGQTKSEVAKKLARLAVSGPPQASPGTIKAGDFLDQYLQHVKAQNSVATWKLRKTAIKRYILPSLGALPLNAITPQHVAGLVQNLRDRSVGASTIKTVHVTLRAALAYALRLELVDRNAAASIPQPKVDAATRKILSVDEARRLLVTARAKDNNYALYLLALTTGMRQGEIFGLEWRHLDVDARRVRIEQALGEDADGRVVVKAPKTKSSRRTIDLPDVTIEALVELRERQREAGYDGPWVFPARKGGPQHKSDFIRRSFKALLRDAELPDVTFHSLRHVANSVLLSQGESVKVAAERLGHSSTRMTVETYLHVLPTTQRSAADRLDGIFRIGGQCGGQTPLSDAAIAIPKKEETPDRIRRFQLVEMRRLELLTPYMRSKCSTS